MLDGVKLFDFENPPHRDQLNSRQFGLSYKEGIIYQDVCGLMIWLNNQINRLSGLKSIRILGDVHWIIGFVSPETPIFHRGRFSDLAPRIDSLSVGIYSFFSIARWCSSQALDSPSNIQRFEL